MFFRRDRGTAVIKTPATLSAERFAEEVDKFTQQSNEHRAAVRSITR